MARELGEGPMDLCRKDRTEDELITPKELDENEQNNLGRGSASHPFRECRAQNENANPSRCYCGERARPVTEPAERHQAGDGKPRRIFDMRIGGDHRL